MTDAVIVLSGGQDSTTCLFWARQHYERVRAVTFDYGQRHRAELDAARTVARMAGIEPPEVIEVPGVLLGRSPLVDQAEPLETYRDFASMDQTIGDRVELTFVPMRNLLFLTIAANRAVVFGASTIVTGICQADNANYPDCREVFALAAQQTINTALGLERDPARWITMATPLMDLSKADSIRLAATLPGCMDALAWSHTCYAGMVPPCGECHACVLRAHGFADAGVPDPLVRRTAPLQVG